MAHRDLVRINQALCDGCGLCVDACAEGAIQIIDGKARLVSQTYCDGLGACLGQCPQDAISIERVEAKPFDEAAVHAHLERLRAAQPEQADVSTPEPTRQGPPILEPTRQGTPCACPGARAMHFARPGNIAPEEQGARASELTQWPIQMHLVSPMAPYYKSADLLLAADCVAYAMGDLHRAYLRGKALAICCPKLDAAQEQYVAKLVTMIDEACINTITVVVMQVPCCRGLLNMAQQARTRATRHVPIRCVVVGVQGEILSDTWLDGSNGEQHAAAGTGDPIVAVGP